MSCMCFLKSNHVLNSSRSIKTDILYIYFNCVAANWNIFNYLKFDETGEIDYDFIKQLVQFSTNK